MTPVPSKLQLDSPETKPRYALWANKWDDRQARNLLLHFIHQKGLDEEFLNLLARTELVHNIALVDELAGDYQLAKCHNCHKTEDEVIFTKLCAYLCSKCINGIDGGPLHEWS